MVLYPAKQFHPKRRLFVSRFIVCILNPIGLAAFVLCLFLSGCIQWNAGGDAVITAGAADPIPYSGNSYSTSDGGRYTWSSSGVGNDYHYVKCDSDGTVKESGLLRVLIITGNIYAVQTKNMNDDQSAYIIGLFSITPSSVSPVKIDDGDAAATDQIASRFNVHGGSLFADGNVPIAVADYLKGDSGDILGFLRALRSVNFVEDNS